MEHQPSSGPSFRMATVQSHYAHAGRQCHGALWSSLQEICALLHLPSVSPASHNMLFQHVQFKPGQRIHRTGEAFDTLYVVNSGFLTTALFDASGNEQVLSFPMKGDMLGMDAIHCGKHTAETRALSECDLILVPFARLNSLSRVTVDIENLMYCMMSRELAHRQTVISVLGTLAAEARVAHFLMELSSRFAAMGYSSTMFNLPMTRQQIGSYLGLTLETVSRTLSAFNDMGVITVLQRMITIHDTTALGALRRQG